MHHEKQTVVSIPVPKGTKIRPVYEHPVLRLGFSPSLARTSFPALGQNPLVQQITPVPQDKKERIEEIDFTLNQRIKFLVTRANQKLINLLLVPAPDPSPAAKEQTAISKQGEKTGKLQDIQFSSDEKDNQIITLTADQALRFRVLPSRGNRIKLKFPGLQVPVELEKIYRLRAFQTTVESALLQSEPTGGVLLLKTRTRSPIHIDRNDTSLKLLVTGNQQLNSRNPGADSLIRSNPNPEKRPGSQGGFVSTAELESAPGKAESVSAGNRNSEKQYTGQPISIDLQDAEVEHVLRLLSTVAGYNLVLDQGVQGRISLKLDHVPWDQALDIVLNQLNLEKTLEGNVLRILTVEQYNKEQELKLQRIQDKKEAEKSREELTPLVTRYIQVNYTKADDLEQDLTSFLSERGKLSSDSRTNQLIIHDTPSTIRTVRSVVKQLDRPERQVLIEARLVYVTDEFQRSMGIKWGGGQEKTTSEHQYGIYGTEGTISAEPQVTNSGFAVNLPSEGTATLGIGGFISKLTGSNLYTIDAQLQLGESQGQVQTISSPRIITLNNKRAEVTQGTKIATQAESESGGTTTEYVDATLKLSVQPQITPDEKIILDLEISDDSPTLQGDDINTRSAQTKLIVDNEETIVIGGVQQSRERNGQSKVPGAGNIPILGWLFKNKIIDKDKQELLIFIRPKIID